MGGLMPIMLNAILENFKKIKWHASLGHPAQKRAIVATFLTLKGGVGKTTLAFELSKYISLQNARILVIDLDPQANMTLALSEMSFDEIENQISFYDIMFENKFFKTSVLKTKFNNIDLLPSTSLNAMINQSKDARLFSKSQRLIKHLRTQYDFIIMDCNPTSSVSHAMAVINSDIVFSPILLDAFSIQGLNKTIQDVKNICGQFGSTVKHHVLFNKLNDHASEVEKANHIRGLLPQQSCLASFSFWNSEADNQIEVSNRMSGELDVIYQFLLEEATTHRWA